jgi:hypothetical protein
MVRQGRFALDRSDALGNPYLMQILAIVVYSHQGQRRVIPLRTGRLNVITGESRTGKSAVLEIVRFCLGSAELRAPVGVVTEKSAWFGLHLQLPTGQAFIARPVPPIGQVASSAAMLRVGQRVEIPDAGGLTANTNADAVVGTLGAAIGIEENEAVLPSSASRPPVQATLAHALFFCLQRQHEIGNQELLFHRQGEQFVSTHIRDVLPYFLGAVPANHLRLQAQLRIAREELRGTTERLERLRAISSHERDDTIVLLREAEQVGLAEASNWDELNAPALRTALREALDTVASAPGAESPPGGDAFGALRQQQTEVVATYRELHATRRLAQSILDEQNAYADEFDRQLQRMEAVELLPEDGDLVCPVCEQSLPEATPTVAELRSELLRLRAEVNAVNRDEPRLQRMVARVELDQVAARERLQEIDVSLSALARQYEQIRRLAEAINERSYVKGRIDHFLQTVEAAQPSDLQAAEREMRELAERVELLEEEIGHEAVRENVTSILNVVGESMGELARVLDLEHATSSVRIDMAKLNVVADTAAGPVPLTRMGSAANWVGYHLVTYLALHRFFIDHARPLPRFLILDQPTQAFYPPDLPAGETAPLTDADRQAVSRMFKLLHDVAEELSPQLQIIVMDHLLLRDTWFVDSIAQNWRDGDKLIPSDW